MADLERFLQRLKDAQHVLIDQAAALIEERREVPPQAT